MVWVETQQSELIRLGRPLGLFNADTVPEHLRNKFVVADSGSLQFFDTHRSAGDAAQIVMMREIGPLNAAYCAATDKPLPTSHVGYAPGIVGTYSVSKTLVQSNESLISVLSRSLHSLGISGPPRALTWDEVTLLSMSYFDELQMVWVETQQSELIRLGRPLGLFNADTVPEHLRNKFVVADSGSLQFFDTHRSAGDAAQIVMMREIGPLNAAYCAATDKPLPTSHVGYVASEESSLVAPNRMNLFEDVRRNHFTTSMAYDKLPMLDVIVQRWVNGSAVASQCLAVYDSGSFDAFYTVSDTAQKEIIRGTETLWVHPSYHLSAVSDMPCTCSPNISLSSIGSCPLWQEVPFGGKIKRDFLNWKGEAVLVVGARLVSTRWKVRVLVDTNANFYGVPKDAISLIAADLLDAIGLWGNDSCASGLNFSKFVTPKVD